MLEYKSTPLSKTAFCRVVHTFSKHKQNETRVDTEIQKFEDQEYNPQNNQQVLDTFFWDILPQFTQKTKTAQVNRRKIHPM